MTEIPEGLPFSQAYLRPERPLSDSAKFRTRLVALFYELRFQNIANLPGHLKLVGGIEIRSNEWGEFWQEFFKQAPIIEVLDAIGIIYGYVSKDIGRQKEARNWKNYIERIFNEQAMGYRLDDKGAVRKLVDDEFQRNRFATITGLGLPRYKSALDFYERASAALEAAPIDTLTLVRGVFDAAEEIFKLMLGLSGGRLVAGNARQYFDFSDLNANPHAKIAAEEMANAFAKWVGASQQFRHAPGPAAAEGADAAPPVELALMMFAAGSGFIRWLIVLDQQAIAAK